MNESLLVNLDVDYTQALPIQQKRIIAFINHFLMNTVSFLNTFTQACDTRMREFEFKLQKVEASLTILESQLSSISNEHFDINEDIRLPEVIQTDEPDTETIAETPRTDTEVQNDVEEKIEEPKLRDDPIYSKYFKMVQVGVPVPAVKLKMKSEGLDPSVLDKA